MKHTKDWLVVGGARRITLNQFSVTSPFRPSIKLRQTISISVRFDIHLWCRVVTFMRNVSWQHKRKLFFYEFYLSQHSVQVWLRMSERCNYIPFFFLPQLHVTQQWLCREESPYNSEDRDRRRRTVKERIVRRNNDRWIYLVTYRCITTVGRTLHPSRYIYKPYTD